MLFNDAFNTFNLRLYGVRHMVKDHSDSERGNNRGALAGTRNNNILNASLNKIFPLWLLTVVNLVVFCVFFVLFVCLFVCLFYLFLITQR